MLTIGHHLILIIAKVTEYLFSINFSRSSTKFCVSLHYNGDNSYLFVNGKQVYNFKADNKNDDFPTQFCLRSISKKFGAIDSREVSLEEDVRDFS